MKRTYRGKVTVTSEVHVEVDVEEGHDVVSALEVAALDDMDANTARTWSVHSEVTDWWRMDDDN